MTNLDSILKSRDITLPTKVHLVKAMVFPIVMYGCESWTIKKAERWRIEAFELWCWRRLLRVPWTAGRSNHSILKEISPEYSLEGLILKLKLQYFGHLMQRADSLEKTLMWERLKVGGEGDDRGWDGWMASPTQWTWVCLNSGSWCWTRLLRIPWTARRSSQSILKEISPGCWFEGLILKLKLRYFGHLYEELSHLKRPWCGKDWRQEEKGKTEDEMVEWHHWLNGHEFG